MACPSLSPLLHRGDGVTSSLHEEELTEVLRTVPGRKQMLSERPLPYCCWDGSDGDDDGDNGDDGKSDDKGYIYSPTPPFFLQVGGPQLPITQLKEVGPRKSRYVGVHVEEGLFMARDRVM